MKYAITKDKREYRLNGVGPVGCLSEWKAWDKDAVFEIMDYISPSPHPQTGSETPESIKEATFEAVRGERK